MHGLINRTIEGFVRSAYGPETWEGIARTAGVDPEGFLTWSPTPDKVTEAVLIATARSLGKSPGECLEDIGGWLTRQEEIRRLLRFSGADFREFLESLRELTGRIALILPEMEIPPLSVTRESCGAYRIRPKGHLPGLIRVAAGVIRGMADDYGALALIAAQKGQVTVNIALHDFTDQRHFTLAPEATGASHAYRHS